MSARPKHITSANWLREELREWASWVNSIRTESENSGSGYSPTTVIGQAVSGHISGTPMGSCIPHGVEPPYSLQRITFAINRLKDDAQLGRFVWATVYFYKYDEDITVVMRQFKCKERQAKALRERGEDALRAFLRA